MLDPNSDTSGAFERGDVIPDWIEDVLDVPFGKGEDAAWIMRWLAYTRQTGARINTGSLLRERPLVETSSRTRREVYGSPRTRASVSRNLSPLTSSSVPSITPSVPTKMTLGIPNTSNGWIASFSHASGTCTCIQGISQSS